MIRICATNFRNIIATAKVLHTSTTAAAANSCILKRFQSTDILENATKISLDENEILALKKERQAEV